MNGRDVFKYRASGVSVEYQAEWAWREAARFAQLSWPQFCALEGDEMAGVVAHHVAHLQKETAAREASNG